MKILFFVSIINLVLLGCSHSSKKEQILWKQKTFSPTIKTSEIKEIVHYLASSQMKGRMSGSPEEKIYTEELSKLLKKMGLTGYKNNSFIQEFPFTASAQLGKRNSLTLKIKNKSRRLILGKDWTPLNLSSSGKLNFKDIEFVGYGLIAPKTKTFKAVNSYSNKNVKSKWVIIYDGLPDKYEEKERIYLNTYSGKQHKITTAKNRGAIGVIFINKSSSTKNKPSLNFKFNSAESQNSIPVISLSPEIHSLISTYHKSRNPHSKPAAAYAQIKSEISIKPIKSIGRNIIATLKIPEATNTIVIGAHADHLGEGRVESSLATNDEKTMIHFGADDNASGVSSLMELAHYFSKNREKLKQNIVFALWSAEELGTLGSQYYLKQKTPKISSYINMDMIGRYKKSLSIQGLGSAKAWKKIIEPLAKKSNLNVGYVDDPYVPTDAMSFYLKEIPVIHFFTGAHSDYHTPRDTADKINYSRIKSITQLIQKLTTKLASENISPKYNKVKLNKKTSRRGFNIYLGTIPDYTAKDVKGLKLSGVIGGGPAEKAGLIKGDTIIQFGSQKIENIYDYMYALQALKPNVETHISVIRNKAIKKLKITPLPKNR